MSRTQRQVRDEIAALQLAIKRTPWHPSDVLQNQVIEFHQVAAGLIAALKTEIHTTQTKGQNNDC